MANITIPPAALEAGAKQICGYERDQEVDWREYIGHARAAITAALDAWPGMQQRPFWDLMTHARHVEIILPQEAGHD